MFNIDKLKLNILALIPLFLLFLPSFGFVVGNKGIVLYYVCLVIFFVIITFTNLKKYVKRILLLYKITPFKYVVYFVLWVLISGFINMLIGHYKFSVFIYYITSLILIDYCLTYLLPCFLYDNKKYNLKFLIKFLFIAYFFIFCFGLVEFIGKTFNISAIINIKLFLSNLREVNLDDIGQITRVSSVFQEPGWFGGFIFINMPIIYKICLSKYKLFENKFMNIIIKHSLVPLMLFNILVCQSAIWFVFCIILTIIFFKQKLKKIVYKYNLVFIIFLSLLVFISVLLIQKIDSTKLEFYKRIVDFWCNLLTPTNLSIVLPTLWTRIQCYIATFKIGLENFIYGVGIGNVQNLIYYKFNMMNNLTGEILYNMQTTTRNYSMKYNGAILWQYFAELGFVGVFLYYYFIYKLIKYINNCKRFIFNIEYDFLLGLKFSLISIACIIFYDITEAYYYIWFLFGLVNIFILKVYYNRGGKDNIE